MRAPAILLIATCFAGSAFAQAAPATPGGNGASATAMPTMVNGKFVVGYDGRGDYLKSEQLEKENASGAAKPAASTELADELAAEKNKPAAPAAAPAAPAATTPAAPAKLRNDSALSSDSSKARAAAAASAPAASTTSTPAPVAPPATPGAPNYNPMVLIGGRIQH